MKKGKKYILNRISKFTGCIILTTTLLAHPSSGINAKIAYSAEDIAITQEYQTTLSNIQEETPVFTNIYLYQELLDQGIKLTKSNLNNITELSILNHLQDPNLSDLKYFPNLTKLTLDNNNLDSNDIKYNVNLLDLNISNSTITNTDALPNTIYNITLNSCIINDDIFTIPYNTKYINTTNTSFNNLYLKNPIMLNRLSIKGNTFLDISSLTKCTNLEYLSLTRVPNVFNSHLLPNLNIKELILDDYSSIWLSRTTYELLKLDNYNILNQINELDQIAHNISINSSNKEEIITNITIYILNKLEYDNKLNNDKITKYNDYPIYTSFNEDNAICINYASLFTALANRLGIDTYQIYSNTHTWNMIIDNNDIRFIDLTQLDEKTIIKVLENNSTELIELTDINSIQALNSEYKDYLYHYSLTLEDIINDESLSQYNLIPTKVEEKEPTIGYINPNNIIIEYNNKLYVMDKTKLKLTLLAISLILSFLPVISKKYSKLLK